ncbi:hypothetical protein B0T10DRAFT_8636 [Thelonectria olida]|uniref:Uncharacterized protein n=1 Tax=Thelonectria olida TaxID=1576542 RepID=A0A9P9AWK2_9HYPO|nr:hypothetical protein B0T10DRAFT_8636 [Thelonectria olida]
MIVPFTHLSLLPTSVCIACLSFFTAHRALKTRIGAKTGQQVSSTSPQSHEKKKKTINRLTRLLVGWPHTPLQPQPGSQPLQHLCPAHMRIIPAARTPLT